MNEDDILYPEQSFPDDNGISEPDTVIDSNEVENLETESILEEGTSGSDSTIINIPEYTEENPLPVVLVEEVEEQTELEVFSLTGSYPGTIADTYLDYFEGIVQKLMPNEHYVVWRAGQYAYNMCYGEDIKLEGSYFSGDCDIVQLYRDSDSYSSVWYVSTGSDSLALSATDIFCYSDLGMYPTLERGFSSVEAAGILFAIGFVVVFSVCHDIFDYIMQHIYRGRRS